MRGIIFSLYRVRICVARYEALKILLVTGTHMKARHIWSKLMVHTSDPGSFSRTSCRYLLHVKGSQDAILSALFVPMNLRAYLSEALGILQRKKSRRSNQENEGLCSAVAHFVALFASGRRGERSIAVRLINFSTATNELESSNLYFEGAEIGSVSCSFTLLK